MKIVLDTNVLVSGLLKPESKPGKILDLVIEGSVKIAFDARIINEYSDVLERPEFDFDLFSVKFFISYIQLTGLFVTAEPLNLTLPDPDDAKFVEVACSAAADFLITGNLRHYTREAKELVKIISPAEFMKHWIV